MARTHAARMISPNLPSVIVNKELSFVCALYVHVCARIYLVCAQTRSEGKLGKCHSPL